MSKLTILEYVVLGALLGFWIFKKFKNYFRSVWLALRMPGPETDLFFGNVLTIKDYKKLQYISANAFPLYGPMFRWWLINIPVICIYEPDHLKIIMSGTKVHSDKNFFYAMTENFIGKGLITNNDYAWKKNRKALQPYFNMNTLEIYLGIFSKCAQFVVKNFPQNNYTNIVELINVSILRSLHKAVLGIDLIDPKSTPFRSGKSLVIERVVKPWLLTDALFKRSNMSENDNKHRHCLKEYVVEAIKNRKEIRANRTTKLENVCLLDMMLEISENNNEFTMDDIVNETITFVLAGQDSVAAALALNIYYLARSPEVQDKAYQEVNEILSDDKDLTLIKLEKLNRMHYLEQCVKESLRLAPSVPLIFRVLREDVQLGNYLLPEGTNICMSPFMTHRLPHIFPNPMTYNPDRFSPENLKKMHPYAFVPFSAGPRNCIGYKFALLEMKTVIAALLKKYKLSLKPGTEEVYFSYRVALRAKGGVWIKATPRK